MSSGKKTKSLAVNAVLNITNTLLTTCFSLITFPYASRVLTPMYLGKVTYGLSVVSYFALFAGLGISTYAIREGGKRRDNREQFDTFASEIFTVNGITSVISLVALALMVFFVPKFHSYALLLAIQCISILNTWIGVSWINIIFEDYLAITIRSICLQVLSIIALFSFVHGPEDYYIYASIDVTANALLSLANTIYVRRYSKYGLTRHPNIRDHIESVLILFSNNLAASIYLNSDSVMIGWILGDTELGYYSTAVKIYMAIKYIISAVYNVAIVRMTKLWSDGNYEGFKELLNSIVNSVITLCIPATVSLICASENLVLFMSGSAYLPGVPALRILSLAFFFAILAGAFSLCVYIPIGREKYVLMATVVSAVTNVALNVFLIPAIGINGAALTTLIAEITVFAILLYGMRDEQNLINYKEVFINILKCFAATCLFVPLQFLLSRVITNALIEAVVFIGSALFSYLILCLVLKNKYAVAIVSSFLARFRRKPS